MKQPLISIIAPAYNHEAYVKYALDSIELQNYQEMELIVIDDASTDKTASAIEACIAQEGFQAHFRGGVKFIRHEKNMDAPHTLNEAIKEAKGEYISIINTDDMYEWNRLTYMMEALLVQQKRLAFSAGAAMDASGNIFSYPYFEELKEIQNKWPLINLSIVKANVLLSTGNVLFEKSLFEEIGGFDASYHFIHDWHFFQQCCLITEPVYVYDTVYYYRVHDHNTLSQKDKSEEALAKLGEECDRSLQMYLDCIKNGQYQNPQIPSKKVWDYFIEKKDCGETAKRLWRA